MYTVLIASKENEEYQLIEHFLDWKGKEFKTVCDSKRLKIIRSGFCGMRENQPILMEYDMVSAIGFYGIVDFIR